MKSRTLALSLITISSLASAQNFNLAAPTMGHVFLPDTSAIHPINGLPGASTLANPLLTGLISASFSRHADTAIVAKSDGLFLVTGLRTPNPGYRAISNSTTPYIAAWGKSSAILYSENSFQFLSRFDENFTATPLNPQLPAGEVTALDYDESAQTLHIAISSPENGGLYRFHLADRSLHQLLTLKNPTALARANSRLFLLDGTTSAIWTLSDTTLPLQIPTNPDIRLTAIAASSDTAKLYAADAETRTIHVYDFQGAPIDDIATPTVPTKLERLGDSNILLISNEPHQPLWIFNGASVFFIPAIEATR